MAYSTILFDIDGTLFDFDRAQAEALEATLRAFDVPFDAAARRAFERINTELWRAFERGEVSQPELQSLRFERLFETLGASAGDHDSISERYLDHLSERAHLLDGAHQLVNELHGDFRMAIITNGITRVQRSRIARSGLEPLFDAILISGEVGCAKPDRRIFELALDRLGSPSPTEVIMIGDSLSSDIRGAVDFGIDACWIRPGHAAGAEHDAEFEIEHLDEFRRILGR